MKKFLLHLLSLVLFTVVISSALADTYYVGSNGNDDGPGTEQEPWSSIRRVNQQQLNPGDIVKFKRGDTWNLYNDGGLEIRGLADIVYSYYGNVEDHPPRFNGGKEYRSPSYQWTKTADINAPNEYYLEVKRGGVPLEMMSNPGSGGTIAVKPSNSSYYPQIYDPDEDYYLFYNPYEDVKLDREPGHLEDDMWVYGRNETDNLSSDTIYIRCDDGNPDAVFSSIIISQFTFPAIVVDNSNLITIDGIELRHIGNWALRVLNRSQNVQIKNVVCKFNYNGIDAWTDSSLCESGNDNVQVGNAVRYCYLTQNTHSGIAAFECGSFDTIDGNECRYNHKYGIYCTSQNKTYFIENNDCHHNSLEILNQQWAYWGIEVVQSSQDHYPVVRYNKSHHNVRLYKKNCDGGGISIRADNAKVYYNLCYQNYGPGIGGGYMEEEGITFRQGGGVYNNVLYYNCQSSYPSSEADFRDFYGLDFKNNIIVKDPNGNCAYLVHFLNVRDAKLGYNCYYSLNNHYRFKFNKDLSFSEWEEISKEINSFCDNPKFINPAGFDFRIRGDSPCRDKGTCFMNDTFSKQDFWGKRVPYIDGTNCDIGINEYNMDWDDDGIPDDVDNCIDIYNPDQKDEFPEGGGNGVGDVCDCFGDLNCDGDVDAGDLDLFIMDFGRNKYNRPCTVEEPCYGDLDCDGDVDSAEIARTKEDFGRNKYNRPCGVCIEGSWCRY